MGRRPDGVVSSYTKEKERVFEWFTPFHEIRNKKLYSTSQTNIALFAPESVVKKAQRIFKDQHGVEESKHPSPRNLVYNDYDQYSHYELASSVEKIGGQVFKNVNPRNWVSKVLLAFSHDGQLKVYYDESPE